MQISFFNKTLYKIWKILEFCYNKISNFLGIFKNNSGFSKKLWILKKSKIINKILFVNLQFQVSLDNF